jgi:1,5-anhydro-D-fructose reductase (1,5-anhydro-D-mannitol-forming)
MLNFAILGTGGIADRSLAPALAATPGARLWSVQSRDEARARSFADRHGAAAPRAAFTDLNGLLKDSELHAVIIATPDRLHADQAVQAALAGKHVFTEKPMAHDVESARAMVQACRTAGVRLGVAYHLRWHAGHRALIGRVRKGALGPLRHVRAQWTYRADDPHNWRAHDKVGRWWSLAGTGTHLIDLVRWTLLPSEDEVTDLRSLVTRSVWKGLHDETAIVSLLFASGATAEILTSVLFDSPSRFEVYGADGSAICEGTLGPSGGGQILIGKTPLEYVPINPYVRELQDFVAAVNENRDPEVPGEEGLRNVQILDAACPEPK